MRITNPLGNQQIAQPGNPAALQGSARKTDGAAAPNSSLRTQSPELTDLLAAVREIPDLRQDVVQDVASRLANGEFSTPKAIDQTVQAMLGTTPTGA